MNMNSASLESYMMGLGRRARDAAHMMKRISGAQKNKALLAAAERIRDSAEDIIATNKAECAAVEKKGQDDAFIDRMRVTPSTIEGICIALKEIARLKDPVGEVIRAWERPNGLKLERVRVPIGVIAVIYESRPNVTVDAAAISIKSGNTIILRGGSECIETSKALFACLQKALVECDVPEYAVQFVETPDRDAVGLLLGGLEGAVDLVVPRGGKSLVGRVQQDARVPVLSHLDGICHVYVDSDAELEKAIAITVNSKMRRTGVCGAAETLLIDQTIVEKFWPLLATALRKEGCELRGDAHIQKLDSDVLLAKEKDWHTEYLAPILSVAVVDGVAGAVAHIQKYSSGHTEVIITEDNNTADQFLKQVDSAIVLHNASTQFADGGEFGLGAEIGIATGRLHARGPVGVEELTTYKNLVRGHGQTRP
ncbi:MAG: gamma-glutamyl phosphate reductase [Hyphococcus sp.]|nr:MAG: gamma-glutamyl phosphate reductase [Marinicaulis sp.]